ncbi:metalloendopeptidase OMA1, mitochondrial-like [Penaeus japonicus]|uniref:metalloendopeptidase OMA1, mitochondrial-like n=1 Tax=Penaeus japonicus TaxID=27405 RepID=UPI001C70F914|nr:metalloendopeptidase OMA1, mitochondrial-like [Penaeus japonicus]
MLLSIVTRCRIAGISRSPIIWRQNICSHRGTTAPYSTLKSVCRRTNNINHELFRVARSPGVQPRRAIQTTRPRNVNPILMAVLRPITKVAAVMVGRGFRKWWQSLPKQKREMFLQHLQRNIRIYLCKSCLLEMAQFADKKMPADHPMVKRVSSVGNRLLQANNSIPQLYTKVWTVTVIDDPTVNCFVLPSGDIIMFRGMMELFDNDDQLAMIIAHEMSHAILEHAAEQLSHGYLLDVLILFPLAFIWAFLPSDGIAAVTHWFLLRVAEVLLKLPYSRNIEDEADSVGLQLAAKACYDVREASVFWGKLCLQDELHSQAGIGGESVPAFLSTHPSNSSRQERIDEQMPDAIKLRDFCQCPRLTDKDPREDIRKLQEHLKRNPLVTAS